jgi:hypothetical protein
MTQITLYQRSYPIADSPVTFSFVPHSVNQRHTFMVGGMAYEAVRTEFQVMVPDGAKFDAHNSLLCWGAKGAVKKATPKEVFDLAQAGGSGFALVR